MTTKTLSEANRIIIEWGSNGKQITASELAKKLNELGLTTATGLSYTRDRIHKEVNRLMKKRTSKKSKTKTKTSVTTYDFDVDTTFIATGYTVADLAEKMQEVIHIAKMIGAGDPLAPCRYREILMANYLSHEVSETLQGCDAFKITDKGKREVFEYKTKTCKRSKKTGGILPSSLEGRYDLSSQINWEEQDKYLRKEKIMNYKYHYYAVFNEKQQMKELWMLSGKKVYNLLLPAIREKYFQDKKHLKNQSLYVSLSAEKIRKNGTCLIKM
jgi:hypothetical protein